MTLANNRILGGAFPVIALSTALDGLIPPFSLLQIGWKPMPPL